MCYYASKFIFNNGKIKNQYLDINGTLDILDIESFDSNYDSFNYGLLFNEKIVLEYYTQVSPVWNDSVLIGKKSYFKNDWE